VPDEVLWGLLTGLAARGRPLAHGRGAKIIERRLLARDFGSTIVRCRLLAHFFFLYMVLCRRLLARLVSHVCLGFIYWHMILRREDTDAWWQPT
jgi:hypothetical protein